ncbi:carboxylesterase family protein [Venturia nashicola]|uniref:Carboxylic ester hydrolase n=1 Tax=Venturia nashicola TaxID=86259 RepID=A0A4Z1PW92_9PEZI|nr:carboxylesterase family protein [Venturia nashicola]TLD39460.1 carboxylesterase family protein [Venturia nashicola]
MISLVSALLLGIQCASAYASAYASPRVTDTRKNISYNGFTRNGSDSFLNIPFGQDTGLNRFGSPKVFVPKAGTAFNNTMAGKSCPQPTGGDFTYNTVLQPGDISEDCLNLLVVRPTGIAPGTKLPVMVYIFGGSLFSGTAYQRVQTGEGLVSESVKNGLPVIYVAMNYRLSIFGFALSEPLRGEKSLNVGLRDQRLALDWVQENIALFGGDKDKVTIFGQSSGALSVTMQITAFGGAQKAPFQQAIIESTALEPTQTSNLTLSTFNTVAQMTGCSNGSDPQSVSTLTCLRGLSMESLLNTTIAQQATNTVGDTYLPTIDGDFLPEAPSALLAAGKFSKTPFMAGWTKDDATPFTSPTIQTTNDTLAYISNIYSGLTPATLSTILTLYPLPDFAANPTANLSAEFYRTAQIFRDILLTCPNFLLGAAMAKKISAENPPIYLFMQNQTIFRAKAGTASGLGVFHTSDLPYVFAQFADYNTTGYTVYPTPSDFALLERQSRSWTSFAWTGRPSVSGKKTLEGWNGSYDGWKGDIEGVRGTKVYTIGGENAGLSEIDRGAIAGQKLASRCAFLNSADVIRQLQY